MGTSRITVKFEGLEALETFVARLEDALARVEELRPVFGDVHVHATDGIQR